MPIICATVVQYTLRVGHTAEHQYTRCEGITVYPSLACLFPLHPWLSLRSICSSLWTRRTSGEQHGRSPGGLYHAAATATGTTTTTPTTTTSCTSTSISFQSQPVAQLGVRYMAVLRTGASRALEPHGQVPLRIAANLRPTQLVKRLCMIALVVLSAALGAGQEPECKKLDQCGRIRQPSLRLSVRGEFVYFVHCTSRCSSAEVAPKGTL